MSSRPVYAIQWDSENKKNKKTLVGRQWATSWPLWQKHEQIIVVQRECWSTNPNCTI
jgi:hypothetical protein